MGSEEIKKYKITDSEGVELFLEQHGSGIEEKPEEKPEDIAYTFSKKKIVVLALSVILFFTVVAAVFIHIQNIREERIAFNKITEDFNSVISIVKAGNTSGYDPSVISSKLDSTVKKFKKIIAMYPGDSRIEKMYGELIINKYAYMWLSQLDEISQNIITVDAEDGEDEQAIKYSPDLLFVFRFLTNISYFLQYNSLYSTQPELATFPPQSWLVDTLALKGKELSNLLKEYEITLQEKFPGVYKYVKFVYNDIYPTIFTWQSFWDKYYQYSNSYDEDEKSRLLKSLQAQFPVLDIINDDFSNQLNSSKNITIGISRSSIIPSGSTTFDKEWEPIISFLKNKIGGNISLKIFNSEEELKNDFIDEKVDFAVFNNVVSGNLFASNIGDPILIRVWNTDIQDNVIMITRNKNLKDIDELKGKKVSFSKNAFSAPYLYFYKKNIEPELYFSKVNFTESSYQAIEDVAHGNSDVAFVSKENFYYYQHENTNVNLYQNAVITKQPLSILWAREDLSPDVVQDFVSLLSSIDPKIIYSDMFPLLHPYGNWVHFGQKITEQFIESLCAQSDIDVNSIFLMSINSKSNLPKDILMDAVNEVLSDKGFVVVDVNNLKLPSSFIKQLDKYTLYISAEKNSNNNIDYVFDFYWELRDTKQLLFSKKFSQSTDIFPPNLSLPLQTLGSFLPVYVPVTNIDNNIVVVKKPRKIALEVGKIVKFYKIVDKDRNGFRGLLEEFTTEAFGNGKIVSINDKAVTIKVDEQTRKRITLKDYAEIKF